MEIAMTMRTRTTYTCECGYSAYEILSENDQPYSKNWERTDYYGVQPLRTEAGLKCPECGRVGGVKVS